jgi:hypothetical protein
MDFAPFAHPGPDANLPIAHRLVGFSADNATLAHTIYTFVTVSEKKFICCLLASMVACSLVP